MGTDSPGLDNVSFRTSESLLLADNLLCSEHVAKKEPAATDQKRWAVLKLSKAIETIEIVADLLAVFGGILLAYFVYCELHLGKLLRFRVSVVELVALLAALYFVTSVKANGGYSRATSLLRVRETERVIAVSFQLCFIAFAVSFWTVALIPRLVVLLAAFLVPSLVLLEKHVIYSTLYALDSRGRASRRTVIYGADYGGERTFSVLVRSPKLGFDPVAIVDDDFRLVGKKVYDSGYTRSRFVEVIPGPITAELLRELSVEDVVISSPSISAEVFEKISAVTAEVGATLSFIPHDPVTSSRSLSYWDADGMIFASVDEHHKSSIYEHVKRIFDFTFALILILLCAPVLFAIAVSIYLTSHEMPLFIQDRVGKNGKLFKLYKFRTMSSTSPQYAYSPKSSLDPRITKVGAFLRRTSLDELPQLWNVLTGSMSLVGPRPEMPFIVAGYNELHRRRLRVKPGITGMWQISADRAHLIHENIQYDLYYIRHSSFFMDLAIILHTVAFAMRGI
jgi:exopolysaccharide biosynthesis polyprenyl glycosylphosphotransferase